MLVSDLPILLGENCTRSEDRVRAEQFLSVRSLHPTCRVAGKKMPPIAFNVSLAVGVLPDELVDRSIVIRSPGGEEAGCIV